MKRAGTALIAGGLLAGGLVLAGGTANAMPSDHPCGASDVRVTVAPDPSNAAGHEAYVLTYTAASPTTNCKLAGAPTAVSFLSGGQRLPVTATPDGSEALPVNLRAGHPAVSRIVQRAAAAPATPDFVTFDLPTGPYGQPVSVAWPAGAPLKGDTVVVTPVSN
ncbi:DUF4232 domain-containing protein [Amycolatopsis vancoresmycina]|uniref:DUF4232 domain-containing protein n=1 Tax=Amycolatopsis vancoresmycina DSM 44592 TaxID=1292037 RepID=R1HSV9_9PSEU|nr:DUF4232 domain-containing protein [Amycolatopsis vancoresmycina]EOD63406.1 hypothetical protein H480_37165 [Amycolatopsis vancoresmycina DSM 44592]